ncbi:hypothetical protein BGZ98_009333 [Dissophora globulifera]|nr:hypothetical protein BGZ98_009333 [Dissophora globulifera]
MVLITIPTAISRDAVVTSFARIDTDSTVVLEFQGVIEMDGATWASNHLGQLSILDGGVKAQLVIGNHRLDGKVMKLDKPLLLIQKQQKSQDPQTKPSSTTHGKGIDYAMDLDHRSERRSSYSSLPPSSPGRFDQDDTMTSVTWSDHPAATAAAAPGALDSTDATATAGSEETVQYDTVAIIRQKILFNTMPVPIIHTDRRGLTVIKRGV